MNTSSYDDAVDPVDPTVPADRTTAESAAHSGREHGLHEHGAERAPEPLPTDKGGKLGSLWVVLALGAIVTILLLVFIMQNGDQIPTQFLGWTFTLPQGVLILLSAIVGALIMGLFAGVRILQLRMRNRRARRIASGR